MEPNLACPRCREHFFRETQEDNVDNSTILSCPRCRFEYRLSDFKKQLERVMQKRAWPNEPEKQHLLSDSPSTRTTTKSAGVSFGEWIRWKLGHKKTSEILILRSSIHQLFFQCVNLCELYPAIPYNLKNEDELKGFWVQPEHQFVLDNIWQCMNDADELANDFFHKGLLTRGEIRKIIDDELPHASWGGVAITYSIMKPEFRGFLLAIRMLNAKFSEIPSLMRQIQMWLKDDGWDEYGYAKESKTDD